MLLPPISTHFFSHPLPAPLPAPTAPPATPPDRIPENRLRIDQSSQNQQLGSLVQFSVTLAKGRLLARFQNPERLLICFQNPKRLLGCFYHTNRLLPCLLRALCCRFRAVHAVAHGHLWQCAQACLPTPGAVVVGSLGAFRPRRYASRAVSHLSCNMNTPYLCCHIILAEGEFIEACSPLHRLCFGVVRQTADQPRMYYRPGRAFDAAFPPMNSTSFLVTTNPIPVPSSEPVSGRGD